MKAVRELGLERRETVRSLSTIDLKIESINALYERNGVDVPIVNQLLVSTSTVG
jgi:hypothetical protein